MIHNYSKLILEYNVKDAVLVVSSYPKKGERYSRNVCAVASFTKNTLRTLKKLSSRKIIVLTIILDKEEMYEEDNMLIIRCVKRDSPFWYFNLFRYIRLFSNSAQVLIEFEFSSFGNTLATAMLCPFVWSLYLLRKKIILVMHQIFFDLGKLHGHIGKWENNPTILILNVLLKLYYRLLTLPASLVVVLEKELKKRLSGCANSKKIVVIPHGVDTNFSKNVTKIKARQLLKIGQNELVILCFGYIAWYKGTDFFIKALQNTTRIKGKKIKLIIAGGASFTQQNKKHYRNYFDKVKMLIQNKKHITITGFVPEESIELYFKACDIVVFPYRVFMSSSGPFSIALSFAKPFLISQHLKGILKTSDIAKCLKDLKIVPDDVVFTYNQANFLQKMRKSLDPKQYKKLSQLSRNIARARSFKKLGHIYNNMLLSKEKNVDPALSMLPSFS